MTNLTNQRERFQQAGALCLLGMILWGVAFFAPDAGHRFGAFFLLAGQTSWLQPLQIPAAWCSVKIILVSLGALFLLDSVGVVFIRLGFKRLVRLVYFLELVDALVFLAGGFYLIKALL
jgi:hypothetical protein